MTQQDSGWKNEHDAHRIKNQRERVIISMQICAHSGTWVTLGEISRWIQAPEASVSARLRDLRHARYGGFIVSKQRRGEPKKGLWEYRIAKV